MSQKSIHKIFWKNSVWFSDVNDTLINTAKNTEIASEGIRYVFSARFGEETGTIIQDHFIKIFHTMMAGLRNKTDSDWEHSEISKEIFNELWREVASYQREIKEKYGAIKKFSREVFIKIASDRAKLSITPEIIYEAADAYWVTLSEKSELIPGVKQLVDAIKEHNRPLYLITSSDARLKLKPNGQFEYIPGYSEAFKRERMQLLRTKGLDFNLVSIGDPEDKPHIDFFQKGITLAENDLGAPLQYANAIFLGDSFPADLQTPKDKLHFGLVVLFQDDKNTTEILDEHQLVTGNVSSIIDFISEY